MSDKTGIEWTDATWSSSGDQVHDGAVHTDRVRDQVEGFQRHPIDPWQRISVLLLAIAGRARRNHVAVHRLSAQGNRNHMVKVLGLASATVSAETAGGFEQRLSGLWPDVGNTAPAGRRSSAVRRRVCPVLLTPRFVAVHAAQTTADIDQRKPVLTLAAPCFTPSSGRTAFGLRRTGRGPLERCAAARGQSVCAGSIGVEGITLVPGAATAAPLLTSRQLRHVVGLTDADPLRSCARRSRPGAAHLAIVPHPTDRSSCV